MVWFFLLKTTFKTVCVKKNLHAIALHHYGISLISGELKLSELASGEIVSEVRQYAESAIPKQTNAITIIDSAAGVGCPVISSIVGSDYLVAVTEPTPSALHDLKRLLYLANHFRIAHGIVINKCDLEEQFCQTIIQFAEKENIPIVGKIPYKRDFLSSSLKMQPIGELFPSYRPLFKELSQTIIEQSRRSCPA